MRILFQKFFLIMFMIIIMNCGGQNEKHSVQSLVNFSHLKNLTETVNIDEKTFDIVHIYADYPDYKRVDASGEGIACVDDAARAAIVYLRHFEFTGDTASLASARRLIDFCLYMQTDDGQFYNFIKKDYSINKDGATSLKSFNWWAVRGIWAFGKGYRIFSEHDPDYAERLKEGILKTYPYIENLLSKYPETEDISGFQVPVWLVNSSAADASSILMLGLAAFAESSNDVQAKKFLELFADGLMKMQLGDKETFPYGLFMTWRNIWHSWGNSQAYALSQVYKILKDEKYLNAAMLEADSFYPYWLKSGFPREFEFSKNDTVKLERKDQFPQIAYNLRPAILGCLHLYDITKDDYYAELAADFTAWFFGDNPAKKVMYDPESGRCFDGIQSETEINKNSGAESTIEALMAILEIEANPVANERLKDYLTYHKIER